ncbi:MAG: hypothetical protein JWO90_2419 [Solirubrobacterales bacterium]|jgi:pyruvate dehydrogenase E2 component (dihydrolipoamide acetyltransferase)|nr:hypothetical protein [Solirubrobacterales bacterium]
MSTRVEVRIEDPGDIEEVEVVEISVKVGDAVAAGDVILEVATDKANMDVLAPAGGVVEELLVAEGDVIDPKRPLAYLAS